MKGGLDLPTGELPRHIYNQAKSKLQEHFMDVENYDTSRQFESDLISLIQIWENDITSNFKENMENAIDEEEDEDKKEEMIMCIENYDGTISYINKCYEEGNTGNYDPEFNYEYLDELDEMSYPSLK